MKTTKLFSLILAMMVSIQSLEACPLCSLDNSGGQQGNAATWGIIAMAFIMFSMLGALYGFMRYLQWREKNPLPDYSQLVQEGEQVLDGESVK